MVNFIKKARSEEKRKRDSAGGAGRHLARFGVRRGVLMHLMRTCPFDAPSTMPQMPWKEVPRITHMMPASLACKHARRGHTSIR